MNVRKLASLLILTFATLTAFAQTRSIKGTVLDSAGEPLVGAGVFVKGTSNGAVTDLDGKFQINAKEKDVLIVSFLGYEDAEVSAMRDNIKVVMNSDTNFLDQSIVVGYGTQKKATLTGAVSAVNNKEMAVTKNENVINMLTGKIAGVRITQNSAQPGEFDNNIDIRGMGEPLIVVDGVPRDKAYFSRMDANEIDNISVLKDASAAIYGVRAANGVILVTTKHGSAGVEGENRFDITLSANVGIQSFLYLPETADAASHMLLINEKNLNNNLTGNYMNRTTPKYSYADMLKYSSGQLPSTNWTDELFDKVSPQQQYNLSINGGSEKIDYFFNLGYMNQMGSYKSKSLNYSRWNFRSNVDARITKRLKLSVQLSGYTDEKNQPYTDIWAVYKKAWTFRPTSEAYLNGDTEFPAYDTEMLESENPVAAINSALTGYRQTKQYNFNGAVGLTYDIPGVKGLNAKAFYSFDYSTSDNTNYQRTYNLYRKHDDGTVESLPRNTPGMINRNTSPGTGTVLQLSLNYDHTFAEAHHVTAMAMYEETYNKWDSFYAQRQMQFDSIYLFAGEEDNQIGSMYGVGDKSRRSWIGRFGYDYKSKYIIDIAVRADGSSSFPANKRWGVFPSVSAGWRISEEPFVKNNAEWITNLKLRASYGRMGDDSMASTYPPTVVGYELRPTQLGWFFESDSSLMTGVKATSIPNPNLTWYTADTYNIGLDWDLWKQKFGGTIEVFKRVRQGLLATSTAILPGEVGASLPQENLESDSTFGWEIQLSHRNKVGDVRYWVTGQVSATKNRWEYHLDSTAGNSMENWRRTDVSGRNKDIWFSVQEGGRFSNYADIQNAQTNPGQQALPGDYWYIDWNGDGVIDGNDSHPVATYNLPVFNYGVTMGLEWKGLDFSMNWQGAAGVYNSYDEVFTEVGPFSGGAVLSMYKDRWHPVNVTDDPWNPNTEWVSGYYPATGHSFNSWQTGIKNTSYVRLKTVELGYTIPLKWTKISKISDLRVYVNAYNLLTFSGLKNMDPERPGHTGGVAGSNGGILFYNYPVNRVFNFGASLKF